MLTRRTLLALLLSAAWPALPAMAKDDDSGGNSGSGSGNSGSGSSNSGSGSGNSGSGSSNSGSGSDDDDGDDDGGDDDNSDDSDDDDQDKARRAVERGEAIELRKVLAGIRRRYQGRIVSVRLRGRGRNLQYRIRVIDNENRLLNLVVNARTGQVISGSAKP